ncbi:hypothetical protein AAFF_G00406560 [Aldrovandia affinis]|uniref:Nucleobindin-1 n=1 Tax=Aldrovandia affinis TaxID=143900 RepID=A0AAD7WK30_9TELE|nr:hypothetical protein AAFF_G00406560 [Aldrovandia affinis]
MSVSLWCGEEGRGSQEPQLRAPWDPNVSGARVINRLLQSEERYQLSPLYISLIQSEPRRREELAKWVMEVCFECGCEESVYPLSVSLLDRFLSASLSLPVSPLCLSAACVLIASKVTGSEPVSTDNLCAMARFSFLPKNLRDMERVVLATLRWDVAVVTPHDFLPHFLSALKGEWAQKDGETDRDTEAFFSTLRRHSDTLVAMCVCDSNFLGTPPSLIAAAAFSSAFSGLGNKDPQLGTMTATLATLCKIDLGVLQYYTESIEGALTERRKINNKLVTRMTVTPHCLLLLSISLGAWSVPIDHNAKPQEAAPPQDPKQEESLDTGLYYDRYLREVIEVLETDPHFREKLQTANTEDIKNGRLSKELDLVGHHVRTRLDELKRQEVSRLRMLLKAKLPADTVREGEGTWAVPAHTVREGEGNVGSTSTHNMQIDHASLLKQFEHLDPHNQNTFEAKDLELLISTATKDLESYDAERHEEFKRYEMLKEHERREYLKSLDEEKREKEEKRLEELKDKHRQHPKVNVPGSVAQLREVWEETDGLDPQEFNPKTFFKLHDTNGDGVLDEQELEALFTKELEKVYDPRNEEDDMTEMEEERLRMREHVMKNVDTNHDRLVSLEEFLKSTEKREFNNPREWETLDDTKPVYSETELQKFEAELREKEIELGRRAASLQHEQELLKERGKALEAQRKEYQQAVMEMSQRQKADPQPDPQAVEEQPPSDPNGELQFQQGLKKLAEEGVRGMEKMGEGANPPISQDAAVEVQNNLPVEPPQNLPLHTP